MFTSWKIIRFVHLLAFTGFSIVVGDSDAFGRDDDDSVAIDWDVMVAMRDGVRLATDIYRPERNVEVLNDKLPVILMRTPYDKF